MGKHGSVAFGIRIPKCLDAALERIKKAKKHASRNDVVVEALAEYAQRHGEGCNE
jgi:metal-responsive CopG/Arc/MetJ family transcriptional regulator